MSNNCCSHCEGKDRSQTVTGVLERPRYSPGLILEDSDLTAAVDYTRSLNRMLFRSLFGCGVICGLEVSVKSECGLEVSVAPGLALDACGDPVHLPAGTTIKLDRNDGVISADNIAEPEQAKFWVLACGIEKLCAPRTLVCDADSFDGASQPTRVRAMTEITIVFEEPKCVCGSVPGFLETDGIKDKLPHQGQGQQPGGGVRGVDEKPLPDAAWAYLGGAPNNGADCPADCRCGGCGCGCCVLLAKGSWNAKAPQLWDVDYSVRRFVRPLLTGDPLAVNWPDGTNAVESAPAGAVKHPVVDK
jgi:hypothetical protein